MPGMDHYVKAVGGTGLGDPTDDHPALLIWRMNFGSMGL